MTEAAATTRFWHHLPELFLSGLVGGGLWTFSPWAADRPELLVAPAVALPVSLVALLLARRRRVLDWGGAFLAAAAVVAALPLEVFNAVFVLLAPISILSLGAALGVVLGRLVVGLRPGWRSPAAAARAARVGGLLGTAAAGVPLAIVFSGAHLPAPLTQAADWCLLSYPLVPPAWAATLLVALFLHYRRLGGSEGTE